MPTDDGVYQTVRGCVVDGGGINSESEIGRSRHCGLINQIKYNGVLMNGCMISCHTDGCNHSTIINATLYTVVPAILLVMLKTLFNDIPKLRNA